MSLLILDVGNDELFINRSGSVLSGLGIIDFEHWRPTFKQNYGVMSIYVDESIKTMRWQHPWWSSAAVEEEVSYMPCICELAKKESSSQDKSTDLKKYLSL